jgi:cell division protein FtsI/penicillin-binding protein 2
MISRKRQAPGKARFIILLAVISLAWVAIIARLVQIQLISGGEYRELARKQSTGEITVRPDRGIIYDRKGRQVAVNVIKNSLYTYPASRSEAANVRRYLKRLYRSDRYASDFKNIGLKPARFRWLDRHLPDDMAARIQNDSVAGLYIREEFGRKYPFNPVGRQLLGFTDVDGNGISGLEYSFDSILSGTPGLIDYLRDAKRHTYRIKEVPLIEPLPGHSMVLTVDWQFQEIVEEELRAALEEYNAVEGVALFMDCHTGEILAAADCRRSGGDRPSKLKAATDMFEPGSVFKIITAAALLEEKLVDTTELIYCENGRWKCGRRWLRDDKELDSLNFRQVFELSSNIGTGKLALRLGGEKLIKMAKKFGFARKTFIGLPGEQSGKIAHPGVWSDYNVAALAMGHAIAVTPLQLVSAVAAVANGGDLIQPIIIRGIVSSNGKILKKARPNRLGRVIRSKNAAVLRSLMSGVVQEGTATPAQSQLVSIAGKTGTAEVVDPENGGYLKNKFVASFLGYFPADEPRVVGIVVLHQPEPVHYGGHTAGPAFKKMAERFTIACADDIQPDTRILAENDDFRWQKTPDLIGMELKLAREVAARKGLQLAANCEDGIVDWQYPPEGRRWPGKDIMAVLVKDTLATESTMIDLKGMKIRTAMAVLREQGIGFEISGAGIVKKQYPKAGTRMSKKTTCRLIGNKS